MAFSCVYFYPAELPLNSILTQSTWLRRALGGPWYVWEQGLPAFPPPLLVQDNWQQQHKLLYLLSPHSNNQYKLKKQTVQLLFEKETAKTPMVYGLWRWLTPQRNLIPKQLQQNQNPHTKERQNTKSGLLLSTWLYKADMTAEIVLPSNHKAQQSIFFKLFHGELNGKKTDYRAVWFECECLCTKFATAV